MNDLLVTTLNKIYTIFLLVIESGMIREIF